MLKKGEFWVLADMELGAVFFDRKCSCLLVFRTKKAAKKCLPSTFKQTNKCKIVKIRIGFEK